MAASHWCKYADLMTADGAKVDRGGPQELLSCRRGPTSSLGILNKLGKKRKSVETNIPAV